MSTFWEGFEKRAGLVQGFQNAGAAIGRKAGEWGHAVGAPVRAYQAKANNPGFKAMRAASIATLGTGGALYGLNRLAQHDVHQMSGQVPYQGQSGPAM